MLLAVRRRVQSAHCGERVGWRTRTCSIRSVSDRSRHCVFCQAEIDSLYCNAHCSVVEQSRALGGDKQRSKRSSDVASTGQGEFIIIIYFNKNIVFRLIRLNFQWILNCNDVRTLWSLWLPISCLAVKQPNTFVVCIGFFLCLCFVCLCCILLFFKIEK
jgi:hypothetical protein